MATVFMGLGAIFTLIGLVGAIWILIEAFKMGVGEGLLTLCVPCYVFYFVFAKLQHPQKGLMVGMWLGGSILGSVLNGMAQNFG